MGSCVEVKKKRQIAETVNGLQAASLQKNTKEAIEEKLFQTFDLAVTLNLLGSIAASNQLICYNNNAIIILQIFKHTFYRSDITLNI